MASWREGGDDERGGGSQASERPSEVAWDQAPGLSDEEVASSYPPKQAIAILEARLRAYLVGCVTRRFGDAWKAEDAVQHAFQQLFMALSSGSFRARSVRGWLLTVAENKLCDSQRKDRKLRFTPSVPERQGPTGDPVKTAERSETEAALDDCVARLPEDERAVVVLRYFGGMSVLETAERLGITESAVWKRQFKAMQRLRRCMHRKFPPDVKGARRQP